tara:strand:+ start:969 stop:2048 length:1080 start_codon:yes stop_codon:yes gene_type:complete
MIRSFVINKYLSSEFLKITIIITLIFFSLGFILNLFEEINFFKDYDVGIDVPIFMSALFVPNFIYNIFPFIILVSGLWFFLKIKKSDEIIAIKAAGVSNASVISVPCILSFILGIFFVTSITPITSELLKKYESLKNSYEKEQESLASVTVNGIWIKEKNFMIQALSLSDNTLNDVSIYIFDEEYNFIKKIESEEVDISTTNWLLRDAKITDQEGSSITENAGNIYFQSLYNFEKINSLYSNLDTVSFWNIKQEIQLLEERGYSTNEMRAKMHRSFAFPLFLFGMILLSGVFTLGMNIKESNWTYVFIAIITSVLVFYLNDFSAALGKTDKLPIELSVWMPIIIIFVFSTVGIIHANQK